MLLNNVGVSTSTKSNPSFRYDLTECDTEDRTFRFVSRSEDLLMVMCLDGEDDVEVRDGDITEMDSDSISTLESVT